MFRLFATNGNGNVMFAYIMTFHCTSVLSIILGGNSSHYVPTPKSHRPTS